MQTFRKWLQQHNTGRKVLFLFIGTNIVYLFMLLLTIPKTMAFAGGMKLPDMMPGGYSADYLGVLFESLGEEGRRFYRARQLPVDMIYPGLFALTYSLVLDHFLRRIGNMDGPVSAICLLPIIAGAADYGENILFFKLLGDFPDISAPAVAAANVFTIAKSGATTAMFVSLILVLAAWALRIIKMRSDK